MRKSILILAAASMLIASGCQSKAGTGALIGAGGGALIGGVAGGGTGALIGAGAGAVGGAIIGAALDSSEHSSLDREQRQRYDDGAPLSPSDVIYYHKHGVSDAKINRMLHDNGVERCPDRSDAKRMRRNGVSQSVIDFMKRRCDEY